MINIFKQIRYIFTRKQKFQLIILFFIILGGALAEMLGISAIIPFVSVVALPESIMEQPILAYIYGLLNLKSTNEFLILIALALGFIYLAKSIYLYAMYKIQYRFVFNNQMRMSVKMMEYYLKRPYEYHANKNSSEIIRSVTEDVSRLFNLVLNALLLTTEVLVVVCVGVLLILIEPIMTLITLAILVIVSLIFISIHKKALMNSGEKHQKSHGLMIKWISQGLGGIKEIKVMNREQFFIDSYSKAASEFANAQKKHSFLIQVPRLFIETISICGMLIAISVMLYNGRDISAMLPKLAAFAVAAVRIMPSFNRITIFYNGVLFEMSAINLVYNDIKESEFASRAEKDNGEKIYLNTECNIKVNNLTYKYTNAAVDVINDVSFDIPLKKSVAIIGTSGTGKTTFADILMGLLKPTLGTVKIGGTDIHQNVKEWSKKIGYIPQNIYLCDDTIKNNVAFGICANEIDEERVWSALEKAQLKTFVEDLPDSLNTFIGERGIKLSGGQRQRIGIARAFYYDPEILLLDEATSSLDNDTEEAVMEAINAVQHEKTIIIIAHRLSTIRNCDTIIKIENGKIEMTENTERA